MYTNLWGEHLAMHFLAVRVPRYLISQAFTFFSTLIIWIPSSLSTIDLIILHIMISDQKTYVSIFVARTCWRLQVSAVEWHCPGLWVLLSNISYDRHLSPEYPYVENVPSFNDLPNPKFHGRPDVHCVPETWCSENTGPISTR